MRGSSGKKVLQFWSQMIEQQNVEEGFQRLSSTTPTPTSTSHRNVAHQFQNLHLEPASRNVNNNFTPTEPRTPSLPRHPDTSTPNFRGPAQKMNFNVSLFLSFPQKSDKFSRNFDYNWKKGFTWDLNQEPQTKKFELQ